ncbi:unnamed protein product [Tuber melanosporum]|uniref:(Perigord truffle) hypothetical protein n=1 Tax=Tuber melanosporum (strain Mel28) TaxID=656061 RepID=D5GPV1_TUBMM|nr:uncharacterized protein GSTUM_00012044001 [Tuber melanosporum]CAZ86544.1 unnamed protein product [Tuber melanosporum]
MLNSYPFQRKRKKSTYDLHDPKNTQEFCRVTVGDSANRPAGLFERHIGRQSSRKGSYRNGTTRSRIFMTHSFTSFSHVRSIPSGYRYDCGSVFGKAFLSLLVPLGHNLNCFFSPFMWVRKRKRVRGVTRVYVCVCARVRVGVLNLLDLVLAFMGTSSSCLLLWILKGVLYRGTVYGW